MATIVENLPDEILLIICQYLSQYDIINAFFDLNSRLNRTISQFYQSLIVTEENSYRYKPSYELLCKIGCYLQSLTIKGIYLPAVDIGLASNIQELTFLNTEPNIIPTLPNLTDLNVITCRSLPSIDFLFSNHDTLHSVFIGSNSPLTIPTLSPSKYSTIKQLALTVRTFDDFFRLLHICPSLTCLNLVLQNFQSSDKSPTDISSTLQTFSLRTPFDVNITFDELKNIFQYLPSQLEQLAIEIYTTELACVDGELWENYLKEKFPELNCFEFFILIRKEYPTGTKPLRLPEVLKSFHSLYWSTVTPQKITGYYNTGFLRGSLSIHTETIPIVRRRRYFLY